MRRSWREWISEAAVLVSSVRVPSQVLETMRCMISLVLLALALSSLAHAQNILNASQHAAGSVRDALTKLNGNVFPTWVQHDQTCRSGFAISPNGGDLPTDEDGCNAWNGPPNNNYTDGVIGPGSLFSDAINGSSTIWAAYTSAPAVDHHPYELINLSFAGWAIASDQNNYNLLVPNSLLVSTAFCPYGINSADYPPIAYTNVLANSAGAWNNGGSGYSCGYANGIELSMRSNYLGFDTGVPSNVTGAMTAVLATLKHNHPSWTWGDVKGALRQTASCWNSGYAVSCGSGANIGFGYGNIDFVAANSISSANNVYLQPPGMKVIFSTNASTSSIGANITLYPFRQTRRVREVVYMGGTWPAPATGCAGATCNEYTAAQIAAAGGTLIYTSNGTDVNPTFTYPYQLPPPLQHGAQFINLTLVALTLDANGNGSRVESFMTRSNMVVVEPVVSGQQAAIIVNTVLKPLLLQ